MPFAFARPPHGGPSAAPREPPPHRRRCGTPFAHKCTDSCPKHLRSHAPPPRACGRWGRGGGHAGPRRSSTCPPTSPAPPSGDPPPGPRLRTTPTLGEGAPPPPQTQRPLPLPPPPPQTRDRHVECPVKCSPFSPNSPTLLSGPPLTSARGPRGVQTGPTPGGAITYASRQAPQCVGDQTGPDLPPASAGSDTIRWSRVLLSHTPDAARSY